jgi:hypothetical protein
MPPCDWGVWLGLDGISNEPDPGRFGRLLAQAAAAANATGFPTRDTHSPSIQFDPCLAQLVGSKFFLCS